MSDITVQFKEPNYWDGVPFQLPPTPLRDKVRKALADGVCGIGMSVAKAAQAVSSSTSLTGTERNRIAPRKILVVRRGGLGDALMATPLLRGLREHFPSARVYFLTGQPAVAGLQGCPWVDEILVVPTSKKDWPRMLRKLRGERIDTAFILHRFFAASLLAFLAGIPQRLGFAWKNHGFALTGSIPFSAARSQAAQIGQLLTLLGKPAAEPTMEFRVSDAAVGRARELLEGWGFDPAKPLVGVHPGGGETTIHSDAAKRWLPERFGQLADLVTQRGAAQVVILQGPGDERFVGEALRSMSTRPLGIASGLSIEEFAAVIGECDLVVANDTGPMHLAAAQKVPVVAIIGPTHPAYTPPRGGMDKVIWAGAPCSPCYHPEEYVFGTRQNGKKVFECWRGTHECMTGITAEEAYEAAAHQLGRMANQWPSEQAQSALTRLCR